MIYFDSLASFPLLPEVQSAMSESFIRDFANPSASHLLAEASKEKIEQVRRQIADSIDALPSEIVFTSGATESNNLIIKSVVERAINSGIRPHIVTSKTEHKCILAICGYLNSSGCEVTYLAPESDGSISLDSLKAAMKENTVLVSLMHVNNELGTVYPIREFGKLCFERGVAFHSDVAQSFQKKPINVEDDYIDFLSISAHKIGGPKGIGAAYIRNLRDMEIMPVIHGAGQEFGLRGGTLATPLIVGFGAALEAFNSRYEETNFEALKSLLLSELSKRGVQHTANGGQEVLSSCVSLTLKNIDVGGLLRTTSNDYCLSQSSACSAGSIEPSHVLTALGFDRETAENTLRISFSFDTQRSHIMRLADDIERFKHI